MQLIYDIIIGCLSAHVICEFLLLDYIFFHLRQFASQSLD